MSFSTRLLASDLCTEYPLIFCPKRHSPNCYPEALTGMYVSSTMLPYHQFGYCIFSQNMKCLPSFSIQIFVLVFAKSLDVELLSTTYHRASISQCVHCALSVSMPPWNSKNPNRFIIIYLLAPYLLMMWRGWSSRVLIFHLSCMNKPSSMLWDFDQKCLHLHQAEGQKFLNIC